MISGYMGASNVFNDMNTLSGSSMKPRLSGIKRKGDNATVHISNACIQTCCLDCIDVTIIEMDSMRHSIVMRTHNVDCLSVPT